MRYRFFLWILFLSLTASAGLVQVAQADAGQHKIYLPVAVSSSAAPALSTEFPNETEFIQSVINQKPEQVTGVYVPSVMARPVVQQPSGGYAFVSSDARSVTQFSLAAAQGVTGLLAHNGLAGKTFFDLKVGQKVSVVYGSGRLRRYRVTQILRFQAVEPFNTASDFIDLSDQTRLSAAELFARVYLGSDHVTFQTCITQNGNASWGRLFVIAEPE